MSSIWEVHLSISEYFNATPRNFPSSDSRERQLYVCLMLSKHWSAYKDTALVSLKAIFCSFWQSTYSVKSVLHCLILSGLPPYILISEQLWCLMFWNCLKQYRVSIGRAIAWSLPCHGLLIVIIIFVMGATIAKSMMAIKYRLHLHLSFI